MTSLTQSASEGGRKLGRDGNWDEDSFIPRKTDCVPVAFLLAADVESFRRLVERYHGPLLTLIRNLTPPDTDHEGVAEEVLPAA